MIVRMRLYIHEHVLNMMNHKRLNMLACMYVGIGGNVLQFEIEFDVPFVLLLLMRPGNKEALENDALLLDTDPDQWVKDVFKFKEKDGRRCAGRAVKRSVDSIVNDEQVQSKKYGRKTLYLPKRRYKKYMKDTFDIDDEDASMDFDETHMKDQEFDTDEEAVVAVKGDKYKDDSHAEVNRRGTHETTNIQREYEKDDIQDDPRSSSSRTAGPSRVRAPTLDYSSPALRSRAEHRKRSPSLSPSCKSSVTARGSQASRGHDSATPLPPSTAPGKRGGANAEDTATTSHAVDSHAAPSAPQRKRLVGKVSGFPREDTSSAGVKFMKEKSDLRARCDAVLNPLTSKTSVVIELKKLGLKHSQHPDCPDSSTCVDRLELLCTKVTDAKSKLRACRQDDFPEIVREIAGFEVDVATAMRTATEFMQILRFIDKCARDESRSSYLSARHQKEKVACSCAVLVLM